MSQYKVEIRQVGDGGFYFVFRLSGNKAFISNFFESLDETLSTIKRLQLGAGENRNYLQKITPTGEVFFIFKLNGVNPIGQSTTFNSVSSLEMGINLMKSYVKTAEVEDLTVK